MKRLVATEDVANAKAKILEIIKDSDELLQLMKEFYKNLSDLYNNYPNVYEELQRIVKLPTNQEAQDIANFNKNIKEALQYLNDEHFMQSVMDENSLDAPIGDDKHEYEGFKDFKF